MVKGQPALSGTKKGLIAGLLTFVAIFAVVARHDWDYSQQLFLLALTSFLWIGLIIFLRRGKTEFFPFTTWKFWVLCVLFLALSAAIYVGATTNDLNIGTIAGLILIVLFYAGYGLSYWLYKVGLIRGVEPTIGIFTYLFWPMIAPLILIVLSKRPSKKVILVLSLIILLIIIAGISGCAQQLVQSRDSGSGNFL